MKKILILQSKIKDYHKIECMQKLKHMFTTSYDTEMHGFPPNDTITGHLFHLQELLCFNFLEQIFVAYDLPFHLVLLCTFLYL